MKAVNKQHLYTKWRIQNIAVMLFCLFALSGCSGLQDKEEELPTVEIRKADFEESAPQVSVEEDTVMEDSISKTLPEIPVEKNGMLEINAVEDMISVSADIMTAQVSLQEILTGIPVLYDRFRIDGWVFEWLISDYYHADDNWALEEGVLVISREGNREDTQVIHVTAEGGYGTWVPIKDKFENVDVNFDHIPDLLICTGCHGNQMASTYYCFLQTENGFVESPSFTDILNPAVDVDNELILSQWRNSGASHSWAEYKYQDNAYVMYRELCEDAIVDGNSSEDIWVWTVNDEEIGRSDELSEEEIMDLLYNKNSEWRIAEDRWRSIYNNGLIVDYSIYSEPDESEIPIDFPFEESESYFLTLVWLKEPEREYELRLYNESGEVLQQISCGALTEPIKFSYDSLYYNSLNDLEVFPADGDKGLLFGWDGSRFLERPVEIPKYAMARYKHILTTEEKEAYRIEKIYHLNEEKECVEEVRVRELQKDTGMLKIWDSLEKQSLFEGVVFLTEDGNLSNEKYYDLLFWEDRYWQWRWDDSEEEDTSIRVWLDEPRAESPEDSEGMEGFEWSQREVFGNNGHVAEYESRGAFLSDFGFKGSEPMYQYYDRYHRLLLELYGNKEKEQFCGISYSYHFNNDHKKIVEMSGFTINSLQEQKWEKRDVFDVKTIYGDDGVDCVEDYKETIKYTPAGKPDYYLSQGLTDDFSEESRFIKIIEISHVYRDDDTLFYREYWHNPLLFSTTLCYLESFYDENERVIYENGYITHGNLEYYYIYEDKGSKPAYCLIVDDNLGYKIANLVQYY